MQKGFSLIEVMIVLAIVAILSSIAMPLMKDAMLRAHIGAAAVDAKALHVAFKRYQMDFSGYPNEAGNPSFQLDTFEPLVNLDLYDGRVGSRLHNGRADGYASPDDQGVNQEFWLEFSLAYDPTVRFLVSDSDNAPLSGGKYYDGIYLFRNGVMTPLPGNLNQ